MKSLVIELQQNALDKDILISDLLRKAYVVSRKLQIKELEQWISSELNGYSGQSEAPKYRILHGTPKFLSQYHGWQPIYCDDLEFKKIFSTQFLRQRIAEIDNILNSVTISNQVLTCPYAAEQENILYKLLGERSQITLIVTISSLIGIVDEVRNIVLNWALKLEEDGILGEDMTFTNTEKEKVVQHSYSVNNFYAPVTDSQIQQNSIDSTQSNIVNNTSTKELQDLLASLKDNLKDINLNTEKEKELQAEIATVEIQIQSPKPKESIIKEGLTSIRNILEGAGGSGIYQLLADLTKFIS